MFMFRVCVCRHIVPIGASKRCKNNAIRVCYGTFPVVSATRHDKKNQMTLEQKFQGKTVEIKHTPLDEPASLQGGYVN